MKQHQIHLINALSSMKTKHSNWEEETDFTKQLDLKADGKAICFKISSSKYSTFLWGGSDSNLKSVQIGKFPEFLFSWKVKLLYVYVGSCFSLKFIHLLPALGRNKLNYKNKNNFFFENYVVHNVQCICGKWLNLSYRN